MRPAVLAFFVAALLAAATAPAAAQHEHMNMAMPPEPSWTWTTDASVFFGYNRQERKFTDFDAWESQNWFMLDGRHPLGPGVFGFTGMASLEPFTLHEIGSPQVFQTGETFHGAPLIDYQHPHDLIMQAGGRYLVAHGPVTYRFEAYLVGPAALGPTPYMHRASASDNPQSPLSHHQMDSTHITPGVVTGGIDAREVRLEASWFHGAEPDEDRTDLDTGRLDSWSARASWRRGGWTAQVSGGHLHRPEPFELTDQTRLTASIEYKGMLLSRPFAATAAWGETREVHGPLDGYLAEWDWRLSPRSTFFGRAEATAKDLLDLGGPDPVGFVEFHRISHVRALTGGFVRDLHAGRWGRIGVGGDATVYNVSEDLEEPYGSPLSFHVFVRFRLADAFSSSHVH